MSKRLIVLFTLLGILTSLSGCHFSVRDTVEDKEATLPPLRIDSTLICAVSSIDGNRCQVIVLEDSSNYDKDDTLWVTYNSVAKNKSLHREDVITFAFNYITDVSAIDHIPHITVEEVTVIEDYVPPVTESTDEAATT
jgi:hypothetical protein